MVKIKIFIIIMLIICILCLSISVCYADYTTTDITPNNVNSNISAININSTSPLPWINDLKTNNNKSIFSKYGNPSVTVEITNINILFQIMYKPHIFNEESANAFVDYVATLQRNFTFRFSGNNIDSSNLIPRMTSAIYSDNYSIAFGVSGSLKMTIPLDNFSLESVNNTIKTGLGGFACDITYMYFSLGNYYYSLYRIYGIQDNYNYEIKFTFEPMATSVDGVILGCESGFQTTGGTLVNFDLNNNSVNVNINNTTTSITPTNSYDRHNIKIDMLDNSSIKNISYSVSKSATAYKEFSNNDAVIYEFVFTFYSPLLYNNLEYFTPSGDNNTDTPLKLQYYDAEWYQLHYQIANAFIFMITELPIVSDVTNVVYSIINLIKSAFDVLTQFSGFGILFAFGMFAIVVGLLIKLFIGD